MYENFKNEKQAVKKTQQQQKNPPKLNQIPKTNCGIPSHTLLLNKSAQLQSKWKQMSGN